MGDKESNEPIYSRCRVLNAPLFAQSLTIKIDICVVDNKNTILYLYMGFAVRQS